ncbi:DST1 (YGL043W) [Zygosaccharomyces parabailii]|uniref:Transcription elongation factor n=1 Tax=Zygosaccharomyces bailii (strain CLIB 213 / ATCC 58445 / CBS 680 / BCRC 21525 / NBRC 1098 / NCYC 1416 / NRRL Y-2227) TaxID=1333698 RepID=A0A8J2T5N2_ZYGB2|nr:DST1 (YGL043W) [Zygosaccharomyces parabailii]CDF89457.1 ZYBA0S04-04764g1_1 [Zygosaccharomyces bailii CLIB 213]CDH08421.1 probable Transcription elongation factor S-II [Zygosaccharomyces bailii ISA1307]
MDSKEVVTHVKNLEKFKTNDEAVLEILKTLEKEVVPTEKLLRETKVGVEVNKFKKSSNAEIARLVKRMIAQWKDAINKSKKAKMQPQQSTQPPATQASPEPKRQDKYVSTKPRNSRNDGVDTNVYNHKLRDMVIRALYDALAKDSEHPPKSVLQSAKAVEEEMNKLNNCDENEKAYKDKYRIIYSNIISKNNPDLKHKITNGDITPAYLVSCDPKELAPEHLRKKLEEIAKQNLFNAQGPTIQRSVTDRFTCGKCKEKKVSYYQLQTRSADEPLTTFCTCEACGNRWKFS